MNWTILIVLFCSSSSVWHICLGTTWIRHQWMDLIYRRNLESEQTIDSFQSGSLILSHTRHRKTAMCQSALDFRFYNLGEYDAKTVRILNYTKNYFATEYDPTKVPQNLRVVHKGQRGSSITINEIPCIKTSNFMLSVFYFPIMPYLLYVRVTVLPSNSSSIESLNTITELYALAEMDGLVDEKVTSSLGNLERVFLEAINRVSESLTTSNVNYDICSFDVEDHFRLCSCALNAVTNKMPTKDAPRMFFMPEGNMYNVCAENRVNFRSKQNDYDVSNVRTRMVSCKLSSYQFYLVANPHDRGSVFFLLHTAVKKDGTFDEESDIQVGSYVKSIPILIDYDSSQV